MQLRITLIVWLNSLLKALAVGLNPFMLFVVLWVCISPVFNMLDWEMKENYESSSVASKQKPESELPLGVESSYSQNIATSSLVIETPAVIL